jgi:hypothetical protein
MIPLIQTTQRLTTSYEEGYVDAIVGFFEFNYPGIEPAELKQAVIDLLIQMGKYDTLSWRVDDLFQGI